MAIWDVWSLNSIKEVLHPHSNANQERGKEVRLMTVVRQAKVALHFRAERDNTELFTQEGHAVEQSLHKRTYCKTLQILQTSDPETAHLHLKGTLKPCTRFTTFFLLYLLDEVT